jgi:hypothetical protein
VPLWDIGNFDDRIAVLPPLVQVWLALTSESGDFGSYYESLTELNDNGKTFDEIASVIESEPDGLFVKEAA